MRLACTLLAAAALATGSEPATITGRVFDVYHRPVPQARVVTLSRRTSNGVTQLIPGTVQATVDEKGMYRLTLPAGRYVLAVTPPPKALDFASVFPAYLSDNVDPEKAPSIEVRPGELRPFVDFLLLEVESHRIRGRVTGVPSKWGTVAVILSSAGGYIGPLQVATTDAQGRFQIEHVPAGKYQLEAVGPIEHIDGLDVTRGHGRSGSVHLNITAPETRGVQIHLHPVAR